MLKHVLDDVVVWKQPLEELGTYSARHYKKTVRDALAMDYINLDMMVTNSSPCLNGAQWLTAAGFPFQRVWPWSATKVGTKM